MLFLNLAISIFYFLHFLPLSGYLFLIHLFFTYLFAFYYFRFGPLHVILQQDPEPASGQNGIPSGRTTQWFLSCLEHNAKFVLT